MCACAPRRHTYPISLNRFLELARTPNTPCLAVTSSVGSIIKYLSLSPNIFRNYGLANPKAFGDLNPPMSNYSVPLWMSVRASTAAPFVYSEFDIGTLTKYASSGSLI